jgi:alkylhydroperoxidase family enzyme
VQKLGLDDAAVLELMAVVDIFSGFNKLMDGLRSSPTKSVVRLRAAAKMP